MQEYVTQSDSYGRTMILQGELKRKSKRIANANNFHLADRWNDYFHSPVREKNVMNRNVDRSRDVCEPCHDTADISRWTAIRTQCCSQGSTILNMQNDWRKIYSSDIACFRSVRSIDYLA